MNISLAPDHINILEWKNGKKKKKKDKRQIYIKIEDNILKLYKIFTILLFLLYYWLYSFVLLFKEYAIKKYLLIIISKKKKKNIWNLQI